MAMSFLAKAINRVLGGTSEKNLEASEEGELFIAQSAAPYEEINRKGYSFHVKSTTATASVVALPTTTAGIAFFNGASDGGKSAIIDAIYAVLIVGHATLGQHGLIYVVGQTRVAAIASVFTVRKNNGYGAGASNVMVAATGGAVLDAVTGVAVGWTPAGPTVNSSVVSLPGAVLWADIDGKIIVPPGRQFGINVMSSNTENTWNIGCIWHEKQITLG